jgi:hypothetical protein
MAMRETVGTMRAYFIVSGLLGILQSLFLILASEGDVAVIVIAAISFGLSLGFVYAGIKLRTMLLQAHEHVRLLLVVAAGWSILLFLIGLLSTMEVSNVLVLAISLLIIIYHLRNANRLSRELKTGSPQPTQP